jgi:hypothetical protein
MRVEVETFGTGMYARAGNLETYAEWLGRNERPDRPHPKDRRVGICEIATNAIWDGLGRAPPPTINFPASLSIQLLVNDSPCSRATGGAHSTTEAGYRACTLSLSSTWATGGVITTCD